MSLKIYNTKCKTDGQSGLLVTSPTDLTNAFLLQPITSFPLFETGLVTNFDNTWKQCSSLTEFPLIDTSRATTLNSTWYNCQKLTEFPLIDTSNVTNFDNTWFECEDLKSFPPIDTSQGTSFYQTWRDCTNLVSFPLIDTSQGTNFEETWTYCTNLVSFPAGVFDNCPGINFLGAWSGCHSLTDQSILNILSSLDTAGQSDGNINIQSTAATGPSTWQSAADNLKGKGWSGTIQYNGGTYILP